MNPAQVTIQADALAEKFPGVSRDRLIEIAGEVASSQPKPRKPYSRKEVRPEHRCCARVWGTGSGNDQCSKAKLDGSDYCKAHAKKHAECPEPCQLSDDGKRIGLFAGDIRKPLVGTDSSGKWVITWNDPDLKEQMADEKAKGTFQYHPWAPNSGELARSKKGQKATKATKATKADKPKRAKTPYFCFLGENRSSIKAELQQGDASAKISQSAIVKKAAEIWKGMDESARRPYFEMSELDKADKIAAWNAASCTTLTLATGWEHAPVASADTQKDWETQSPLLLQAEEVTVAKALAAMGDDTDYGSSSDEEELD